MPVHIAKGRGSRPWKIKEGNRVVGTAKTKWNAQASARIRNEYHAKNQGGSMARKRTQGSRTTAAVLGAAAGSRYGVGGALLGARLAHGPTGAKSHRGALGRKLGIGAAGGTYLAAHGLRNSPKSGRFEAARAGGGLSPAGRKRLRVSGKAYANIGRSTMRGYVVGAATGIGAGALAGGPLGAALGGFVGGNVGAVVGHKRGIKKYGLKRRTRKR